MKKDEDEERGEAEGVKQRESGVGIWNGRLQMEARPNII